MTFIAVQYPHELIQNHIFSNRNSSLQANFLVLNLCDKFQQNECILTLSKFNIGKTEYDHQIMAD